MISLVCDHGLLNFVKWVFIFQSGSLQFESGSLKSEHFQCESGFYSQKGPYVCLNQAPNQSPP